MIDKLLDRIAAWLPIRMKLGGDLVAGRLSHWQLEAEAFDLMIMRAVLWHVTKDRSQKGQNNGG